MTAPIDLTAALYAQRSKPRGDEAEAHVADLYGCDRATWYRRNGETPAPFSQTKLAQFAIGNGYEREVGDTLRAAGYRVRIDEDVTIFGLTGHPDIIVMDAPSPGELIAVDDLRDFLEIAEPKPGLVIEVKTTEARKPKTPLEIDKAYVGIEGAPDPGDNPCPPHYAIQAATYALAVGAPRAKVLVKYAGTHDEREWDIDPEAWRPVIERRAAEIHARTFAGAPIPPAVPDALAPWGCAYCDWRMCERNPNYVEPAVEAVAAFAEFSE